MEDKDIIILKDVINNQENGFKKKSHCKTPLFSISVSDILKFYFNLSDYDMETIFNNKNDSTDSNGIEVVKTINSSKKKNDISLNTWKQQINRRCKRNTDIGKKIHTMIESYYNNEKFNYHVPRHIYCLFTTFLDFNKKLKKTFNIIHCEKNFSMLIPEKNLVLFAKPDAIFQSISLKNNILFKVKCYCEQCFKEEIEEHFIRNILDRNIIECRKSELLYSCPLDLSPSQKKEIILFDWKYCKPLIYQDSIPAKGLLSSLMYNNKYSSAVVQLNIYRYILEENYDYNIKNMFLCFIQSNNQWEIQPLIYLKKEVIKKIILGVK